MDNNTMLKQFFNSDVGKKIQKEAADETLPARQQLVGAIESSRKKLWDLLVDPDLKRANYEVERAREALKKAENTQGLALSKVSNERVRLEKDIKNKKTELSALCPSVIRLSMREIWDLSLMGKDVSNESAFVIDEIRKKTAIWWESALSFDEWEAMYKEAKEVLYRIKNSPSKAA